MQLEEQVKQRMKLKQLQKEQEEKDNIYRREYSKVF